MVDAFLFVVGLAGLADVDRASVGGREPGSGEAVGAEQAADRSPFARVFVVLESFADPSQEVVGEHADKPKSLGGSEADCRQAAGRAP